MTAFMWVKGSTRSEAVKCWFECVRASKTDPKYEQTNKDKFMENNPNWTDEMYDVKMDVVSDDYLMLFDYAYGISSALGDRKQFDGNQCLVDHSTVMLQMLMKRVYSPHGRRFVRSILQL